MTMPVLALTLGDVAGIGPEITLRTLLHHPDLREKCVPVVSATPTRSAAAATDHRGRPGASSSRSTIPGEATNDPASSRSSRSARPWPTSRSGELSPTAGDGSYRFVVTAFDLAKKGAVHGIVTAPLNKAAMHLAATSTPATPSCSPSSSASRTSRWCSPPATSTSSTSPPTSRSARPSRASPRAHRRRPQPGRTPSPTPSAVPTTPIGVAGLNPHAGENRLFGDEDADVLEPAVARARERGIDAHGRFPPTR